MWVTLLQILTKVQTLLLIKQVMRYFDNFKCLVFSTSGIDCTMATSVASCVHRAYQLMTVTDIVFANKITVETGS